MSSNKLIRVTVTTRTVLILNPAHADSADRDPQRIMDRLQSELEDSKVKRVWLMCEESHNVKIKVKQTAKQAREYRDG